jgi:HEPN domain-containing protein
MRDLEQADMLLSLARRDQRATQAMTDKAAFADEIFGFHAQQAVEKTLKAWLALTGVEYPKTHDLQALISLLETSGESVPSFFRELVDLTDFAVQFRYQAFSDMGGVDRGDTLTCIARVIEHVQKLLPGEVA